MTFQFLPLFPVFALTECHILSSHQVAQKVYILFLPLVAFPSFFPRLCHAVTRMWANAQRDGRPAEYRRRAPLFNTAKFG